MHTPEVDRVGSQVGSVGVGGGGGCGVDDLGGKGRGGGDFHSVVRGASHGIPAKGGSNRTDIFRHATGDHVAQDERVGRQEGCAEVARQ